MIEASRERLEQPLALTSGDPSGIGPEIALRAWLSTHDDKASPGFFIVADPAHLSSLARQFGWTVPIAETDPAGATALFERALPVVAIGHSVVGQPGQPHPQDAAATIASIERCVEFVRAGQASALVTNPISKEVLHRAGFRHPGHTEFLAELALRHFNESRRPVMMLWSPSLAVVPATIHVPLKDVPGLLTTALLIETGRIVAHDLKSRFGIDAPRLAFTGLNPHAGEGGDMGREEIDIIKPALVELAHDIIVSGPHPGDTLFHAEARNHYDAVIAMYHDQALIPIKTLAFDQAVNVTLGLPFIRTSPDHGTAFDIAGRGVANPTSLLAALRLAQRLAFAECPVIS
jgi:4-hydroxythreonine-4-phosphate dehydrogenase